MRKSVRRRKKEEGEGEAAAEEQNEGAARMTTFIARNQKRM